MNLPTLGCNFSRSAFIVITERVDCKRLTYREERGHSHGHLRAACLPCLLSAKYLETREPQLADAQVWTHLVILPLLLGGNTFRLNLPVRQRGHPVL